MQRKKKGQVVKLIRYEQRKARKRYSCQICGKEILPGRQYMFYSYLDGFRHLSFFCHIHCDAMLKAWDEKMRNRNEVTHTATPLDADEMRADIWESVCKSCAVVEICHPEETIECANCIRTVVPDSLIGTVFDSIVENSQED